jgi:16S rRNA (cytidine1402-2'-O)-methyltransferase
MDKPFHGMNAPPSAGEAPGTLYVVPTPIGNLEDITLRALRILKEVDVIAAEGVEHTRKLCNYFGIQTPLTAYNQHNHKRKGPAILKRLRSGEDVALVSNAGTPGISDPGTMLVGGALDEGIPVSPLPGACAAAAALSASGLRSDGFLFAGFLSSRKGRRLNELASLAAERRTLVFYEAPHRIMSALGDMIEALGDRQAVVAREMTKLHEEILRGSLSDIAREMDSRPARGEITVVVEGSPSGPSRADEDQGLQAKAKELLEKGMGVREAAAKLSLEYKAGYRHIYRVCLSMKKAMRTY